MLPAGADVLEPQAPGQALALVSRVAGALREEVAKRRILVSQALRETGGGNRSDRADAGFPESLDVQVGAG